MSGASLSNFCKNFDTHQSRVGPFAKPPHKQGDYHDSVHLAGEPGPAGSAPRRRFEKVSLDVNMEQNGHGRRVLAMQWILGGSLACFQRGWTHEFGISASSQGRKKG